MTRRVNQTTGQEEELVGNEWRPVTTASPLSVGAATPEGAIANMPARSENPGTFAQGFQDGFQHTFGTPEGWRRSIGRMVDGWGVNSGSTLGADVGAVGARAEAPQLTFGSGILPEDQAFIDAMRSSGSSITAPQLPEIPAAAFEADPGLQTLADHARNRQTQVDELIQQLRGDRESEVGRATSKWMTLGRWLGQVSAVDDLSQGGVIMERVLRENQDMRDELRQETLQYVQMGMSAEDAVVQAQAALLSGQAQARRDQAMAGYNRDTAQAQLDFNAQTANAQNSRGVALAIAEATRDAAIRAREGRTQAAQALTSNPTYADQAFGVIAGNVTDDPATQDALAGTMSEQQMNLALMNYVAQYTGSDDRRALQFLQQWDPRLTSNDLKNSTPQQLMLRLTRSPNSRAAFARNRDYLMRSAQFGAMMQPAQ